MQIFELFATIALKDELFNTAIDRAIEKANLLFDSVTAASDSAALSASEGLSATAGSVAEFTDNMQAAVQTTSDTIGSIIDSLLVSARSGMNSVGDNMALGLWNGLSQREGWLHTKINSFMSGVVSGVKSFFGIKSPSALFRDEIGAQLAAGLGAGIEKNSSAAASAAGNMAKSVFDNAKLWIDSYRLETDNLASEELSVWDYLGGIYSDYQNQKLEAAKAAAELRGQITEDEAVQNAGAVFADSYIGTLRERSSALLESVRAVALDMKNSFDEALTSTRVYSPDMTAVSASSVPAAYDNSAAGGNAAFPANVVLNLNGVELARALISDLRTVSGASPQLAADF